MRNICAGAITDAVKSLCIEACCRLPEAVVRQLERAKAQEAENSAARAVLSRF